ncbi:ABC transporter substrate-binding protein [Thermus sp. NMX2.A1]|uniref:ABC transporter substrate-binding protein n=1 Tax=Thermus sp. NMX2.A1 TaxID=570924 RepID=UPI00068E77A4|nr:ABC transporter substrate-binding protein [Thermus sp. NMX2.A1]
MKVGSLVPLALALGAAQAQAQCSTQRPIVFADYDWESARVHNRIAQFILEKGYGCRTDTLPGTSIPLLTGLARGNVDVSMEIWYNLNREAIEPLEAQGRIQLLGVNFPDAVQGWFVPSYVIKGDPKRGIQPMAPELRSVFDLPRYKELFRDPEEPSKGRFYNGALGWFAERINTRKLYAYGLLDHFTNFRPGTGEALVAGIASAYQRGQPILFYYWGPTWVLGRFDLTMLEEPPYDPEVWRELQRNERPRRACAFPLEEVYIAVNTRLIREAPEVVAFLQRYRTSNRLVSELLAYMEENKASEAEVARHFLRNYPEVWSSWVPQEVRERVARALN